MQGAIDQYRSVSSSEPGPRGHWFEPIAEHLGRAYLRYSFTKGTEQEVDFLVGALGLRAGQRVLDVGCGPGRHAHALARRAIAVVGVDISARFIALAENAGVDGARFVRADARRMPFARGFDAAMSLCQGGFGLLNGEAGDLEVLAGMRRAVAPGGLVALSAFSAYFRLRHPGDESVRHFDADSGVDHETTSVLDEDGRALEVELATTCYTPRELRLLAVAAGLEVEHVWSVEPGAFAARPPDLDHAEFLLVARTPPAGALG